VTDLLCEKVVTIVIATFNSMHVLPKVLTAIKNQTIPFDSISVVLVDGGSTDGTVNYGESCGCKIVKNPRTEPVYAKYLGFLECETQFLVYLDHDEVFDNCECLRDQVDCAASTDSQIVLSSGYVNPKEGHAINNYINEYGDPFSRFVYNSSKEPERFITELKQKYTIIAENDHWMEVDFSVDRKLPLIELLAMGTMIDKKYFVKNFSDVVSVPENLPHLFYFFLSKKSRVAICKKHKLVHYSSESILSYLKKIEWRIKNNVHHAESTGASGFLMREKLMSSRESYLSKYKKFLFIPYSILIFPCVFDSLFLAITRRKLIYLIHAPLCVYTSAKIITNIIAKFLGFKPNLRSYDGKIEVKKND